MATLYSRSQPGYVTGFLVGGMGVFAALLATYSYLRRDAPGGAVLVAAGVAVPLLLVAVLFSRLNVEVTERDLVVRFGPGWKARRVPLGEIEDIDVIRYPWYYGWGIRLTPKGTLYNVSGSRAVHLRLRNGKRVLVGSDEPERLAAVLVRHRRG